MGSQETARRFFRSAGAATFSQLWRVGFAFLAELLLRRWVAPGEWGLYEWALPIFLVLGAIRDLGLVYHVARIKPRPYGNLLLLELVWGGALVAITALGAPLLGLGFSEAHPELVPVLRALGLFLFFEGLSTVPRIYFEYELEIGRAVVPEIVRNLVFFGAALGLAAAGYGVWSLVAGQVLSAAVYAAHLWWRAHGDIPLHWARGRTLRLVLDSLPLAFIWLLLILIEHIDPLILGARFGARVVGEYKFAYKWAFMAKMIVMPAIARALYPAVVAFADSPRAMFQTWRLATLALFAVEVPAAWFLFVNPGIVLGLVGGEQWLQAPFFLVVLCFAPLIDPFSRLGGEVLKALHLDRLWIASSLLTLAAFVGAGIALTGVLGARGMAWANFLPLGGLLMGWVLYRQAPRDFRRFLGELLLVYAAPLPLFLTVWWLFPDRPWWRFGLSLVAAVAALAFYAHRFGRSFVAFLKDPVGTAGQAAQ